MESVSLNPGTNANPRHPSHLLALFVIRGVFFCSSRSASTSITHLPVVHKHHPCHRVFLDVLTKWPMAHDPWSLIWLDASKNSYTAHFPSLPLFVPRSSLSIFYIYHMATGAEQTEADMYLTWDVLSNKQKFGTNCTPPSPKGMLISIHARHPPLSADKDKEYVAIQTTLCLVLLLCVVMPRHFFSWTNKLVPL